MEMEAKNIRRGGVWEKIFHAPQKTYESVAYWLLAVMIWMPIIQSPTYLAYIFSGSLNVMYGFVTYAEAAKQKLLGVDAAVIEKYNVVSAPVAAQMALGAAKASGADIAVSVTGVAGPTGGDEVRPVGTVYLGAARDGVTYVKKLFVSRPDRALVRARAAQAALELGLRLAQGKIPEGTQALTAARQSDDAALAALDRAFVRETS